MSLNRSKLNYAAMALVLLALAGCNQPSDSKEKAVIKPAPKMSNDATAYAQQAWKLMIQLEPVVEQKQPNLDVIVRKPLRELGTEWKIKVKMSDSVTEGKYALCRKAMTELDTWARTVQENDSTQAQAKADYLRDKAQCKDALDHPDLGNTSPTLRQY
ncbi:MAG: hypothetical protein QM666_02535 [Acinetobacter sp.]